MEPRGWFAPICGSGGEHGCKQTDRDNARKGAVKKRTQLQTKTMGKKTWTKRDKTSGEFMDQKKAPAKKKYKGVRKER
jgi:hypothetical protein